VAVAAADITSAARRTKVRGVLLRLVKDASLADDLLHRHVVDGKRPVAGDHHHPIVDGLVVERPRLGEPEGGRDTFALEREMRRELAFPVLLR